MLYRAALILLPIAALAQTDSQAPPPEVDQALRARVTEFFNYHVQGPTGFRKAIDMVAEDTKDYYFSAQKTQFKSFKIDAIRYSDHFTKATVDVAGRRLWRPSVQFADTEITQPMSTTWKIEDGKWVWYRDANAETALTPMGPSDPKALGKSNGSVVPTDFSQAEMDKRAKDLLNAKSSISKGQVKLSAGHASSEELVFHNGQPGSVLLSVETSAKPAGFSAVLEKTNVNAGEDVALKIKYEPASDSAPPSQVIVRVVVAPFNQVYPVEVSFKNE